MSENNGDSGIFDAQKHWRANTVAEFEKIMLEAFNQAPIRMECGDFQGVKACLEIMWIARKLIAALPEA